MSKKEKFIQLVEKLMETSHYKPNEEDKEALDYFNALKVLEDKSSSKRFTENGKKILLFLQQNKDAYNNVFTAKNVGEGMDLTSRTASGAMRKLVTDGYLEKLGTNPVSYTLTTLGMEINPDAE